MGKGVFELKVLFSGQESMGKGVLQLKVLFPGPGRSQKTPSTNNFPPSGQTGDYFT